MPADYPMPTCEPLPALARTLVVRLRNWVGDTTLGLPLLQRLHDAGHRLELVGKRWAVELLAGHGWTVHPLPGTLRERVALLRRLRAEAQARDGAPPSGAITALCLPDSFGSALEMRLAGLRAIGQRHEARGWLLAARLPRDTARHELLAYWAFGDALLGAAPPPDRIALRPAPHHHARAAALLRQLGVAPGEAIVICPFSGGTWNGRPKAWPGFAGFAAQRLHAQGRPLLICPGPGAEEALAREQYPSALLLAGVDLGTYAALLQASALMLANDTGPGHLAAAVGTPLVSVLGPSDPRRWRPWGPGVRLVQGDPAVDDGWPAADAVATAVAAALQRARPDPR